ncbi:60S ribosomal protein L7-1 [Cucumis melo var. makuwa]|uniref:60S ribosomal protein L7-1 n=2 Tax=Cucumis melo TaxID=3656 RepID=A0A5D3E729_CUCMM|nr:60S ribosomal protein L7-1 [Cucumis melo var. makuwa]TYK31095.1 60S ribosomal protein L7-1 [Cucumis melo var. makuwa]
MAMAEEDPKPLAYIPEIILKKRKVNEAAALRRKEQLELRKLSSKKNKDGFIKLPEEFVREYRARELDLVKMKHRTKRKRSAIVPSKSQLIFIIRIQGKNDMHPKTRKILYNLGLSRIFSAVFAKANESVLGKLQRVEPYVTYGYPNLKNVRELVYKKGFAKIDKQRVPLTDNNIIEQALGKHGIVCVEDMVYEIANVGPHFKEVISFLWPFELEKPGGGGCLQGKKSSYKDGGDAGNREDDINDLINEMN